MSPSMPPPPKEDHSQSVFNSTKLQIPLPVHKLDAAREHYTDSGPPPPFVQTKYTTVLSAIPSRRAVALADKHGRLSATLHVVDLVALDWDLNGYFWTLDVDGKRFVVKAYGGGPQGGITYRRWLGVEEGFSELPVAYSCDAARKLEGNMVEVEDGETVGRDQGIDVHGGLNADDDERIDVGMEHGTKIKPTFGSVMDDVAATLLDDGKGEGKSVIGLIEEDPIDVERRSYTTLTPSASMSKKYTICGYNKNGEPRYELNRLKKGRKRRSEDSPTVTIRSEESAECDAKRLCASNSTLLDDYQQQDHNQPQRGRIPVSDHNQCQDDSTRQVNSTQLASLEPCVDGEKAPIQILEVSSTDEDVSYLHQLYNAASAPQAMSFVKKGDLKAYINPLHKTPCKEATTRYKVASPNSPRPSWLRGRSMGKTRMMAERILADKHRIVHPAGRGCQQCNSLSQACITAPGRKHCAFCQSRGCHDKYYCSLASFIDNKASPSLRVTRQSLTILDSSSDSAVDDERLGDKAAKPPTITDCNPEASKPKSALWSSLRPSRSTHPDTSTTISQDRTTTTSLPIAAPPGPLSAYQQANTTLHVSRSTDTQFVPVKLRSCMTLSSFFAMVLAACDLEDQEHNVAAVEVRYAWLPGVSMLIKKKIPDSFVEMLEIIGSAPCWARGGGDGAGKAVVRVLVVVR